MAGIIETCIEASCSAVADMFGGMFGDMLGGFFGPGIVGVCVEPFLGEAPCGPMTWAEVCATLIGK